MFKTAGQELKVVGAEFKAKGAEGMVIEGYASTFSKNPDAYGDIVRRGAFKKTIKQRFKNKLEQGKPSDIVMLWQHREPFGMPTKLSEDGKGLYFEADVTNTSFGREQMEYIRHGVVKQASFGYDTIHSKSGGKEDDHVRELVELKLYEISPVTFGANDETEIQSKRLLQLIDDKFKPFQKLLLDTTKVSPEQKTVVSYQDLPLGDRDVRWESAQAERRVRSWADAEDEPNEKYESAFLWFDSENPDAFGSYKLQIGDVVEGRLVALPRGVFAVAAVLMGARGGVDIPEADQTRIRRQLDRYYAKMREEFDDDSIIAPWNRSIDFEEIEEKAGRVLSARNIKIVNDALESIAKCDGALKALLKAAETATPTSDDSESGKATGSEKESPEISELLTRIQKIKV